mgnify:CR=1 FL=1
MTERTGNFSHIPSPTVESGKTSEVRYEDIDSFHQHGRRAQRRRQRHDRRAGRIGRAGGNGGFAGHRQRVGLQNRFRRVRERGAPFAARVRRGLPRGGQAVAQAWAFRQLRAEPGEHPPPGRIHLPNRAGRHHHHARVFFPSAHASHQARQDRRADLWHHDGLQRHAVLGGNPAGRVYSAAPRSGCALHRQGHARGAPMASQ